MCPLGLVRLLRKMTYSLRRVEDSPNNASRTACFCFADQRIGSAALSTRPNRESSMRSSSARSAGATSGSGPPDEATPPFYVAQHQTPEHHFPGRWLPEQSRKGES